MGRRAALPPRKVHGAGTARMTRMALPAAAGGRRLLAVFEPHADLQPDLPVRDLAILDVAAHLGNFEPV